MGGNWEVDWWMEVWLRLVMLFLSYPFCMGFSCLFCPFLGSVLRLLSPFLLLSSLPEVSSNKGSVSLTFPVYAFSYPCIKMDLVCCFPSLP